MGSLEIPTGGWVAAGTGKLDNLFRVCSFFHCFTNCLFYLLIYWILFFRSRSGSIALSREEQQEQCVRPQIRKYVSGALTPRR